MDFGAFFSFQANAITLIHWNVFGSTSETLVSIKCNLKRVARSLKLAGPRSICMEEKLLELSTSRYFRSNCRNERVIRIICLNIRMLIHSIRARFVLVNEQESERERRLRLRKEEMASRSAQPSPAIPIASMEALVPRAARGAEKLEHRSAPSAERYAGEIVRFPHVDNTAKSGNLNFTTIQILPGQYPELVLYPDRINVCRYKHHIEILSERPAMVKHR